MADLKLVHLEAMEGALSQPSSEKPITPTEPFGTNEDGTIYCNFCGKVYKQIGYMKKHLLSTHEVDDLSLKCRKCQKTFETQKKLSRHEGMKSDCLKKV